MTKQFALILLKESEEYMGIFANCQVGEKTANSLLWQLSISSQGYLQVIPDTSAINDSTGRGAFFKNSLKVCYHGSKYFNVEVLR
jgi:hypothetical protein